MFHPLSPAHAALLEVVQLHRDASQHAALLLGGAPALRRTQRLLDDLGTEPVLTRRLRRELETLRALLSLRHVHDPEWGGVAEIWLLDEALVAHLDCRDTEAAAGAPLRSATRAAQAHLHAHSFAGRMGIGTGTKTPSLQSKTKICSL